MPKDEFPEGYPNKYLDEDGITWTKGRCFFCHGHCQLYGGSKDGKLLRLVPMSEQARMCERFGKDGENFLRFHYHPKRINHALKRVGRKGEDQWQEISYDQALDEIAGKLAAIRAEHGAESLVVAEGTYRSDHLWARSRFTNLFGNPGNIIDPGTVCWCWTYTLNMSMVGWPIESTMPPGGEMANTIVCWGCRPYEKGTAYGAIWETITKATERPVNPAKLIVIDPFASIEALHATTFLPIHPGSDLIVMLAWINHIISQRLFDETFVKYWSNAVFLLREDSGKLLRASEVAAGGQELDYVVWDAATGGPLVWNSDENRYYTDETVDPALFGNFEVTLADGQRISCRTVLDQLAERMAPYTMEMAAEITGVGANHIQEACETYATNGPAWIAWGVGGGDQHGPNSTASGVAKTMLRILTGNVDNPGGEYLADPGIVAPDGSKPFPMRDAELELSERVAPEVRPKFIGNEQFRMMAWPGFEIVDECYRKMWAIPRPQLHHLLVTPTLAWDAILKEEPYPVKAMLAWGSNPLAWAPNTKHVYEALKALELLVVVDYWKTPTAALADYILPAADSLERPIATTNEDAFDLFFCGDRICEPLYDRRSDYDMFRGLGQRLGQGEEWPWERYEDAIAHRFERIGVSYDDLMQEGIWLPGPLEFYKYGQTLPNGQIKGFATPTRKAEIYSTTLERIGYDPIPTWNFLPETPEANPELAEKYPYRLTVGGRWNPMFHSEWRVPGCGTRSMWPDPIVQMQITDARIAGIRDGDWVWIETPRGRIRQRAKLEWGLKRGTVIAQPSWWYPELPAEEPWNQGIFDCGGNVLTDDSIESLDKMGGQWITRGLLCKVYPCIDPRDRYDANVPVQAYIDNDSREFFTAEYANLACASLERL
ncbi:MAG: molybdopterin-dependent oxidoreductase [Coriobacteriales bacterium]|jgi:anaerobic selenocysteine-containing dehydrogenase|nr:molybdopterin-dependent oxidoreductase [Coriobacteriales bacterium]